MQNALEQLVTACECAGANRECPIIEALDDESSWHGKVADQKPLTGDTDARR
jgi:hypothetical protein